MKKLLVALLAVIGLLGATVANANPVMHHHHHHHHHMVKHHHHGSPAP